MNFVLFFQYESEKNIFIVFFNIEVRDPELRISDQSEILRSIYSTENAFFLTHEISIKVRYNNINQYWKNI